MPATNEQWKQGAQLRDDGIALSRALILVGTRLKRGCEALQIPELFGDEQAEAAAKEGAKEALWALKEQLAAAGPVLESAGTLAGEGAALLPVLLDGWTPPQPETENTPEETPAP